MHKNVNHPSVNNNSKDGRLFLTWWIWAIYALLAIAGIPWYWPADFEGTLFGLPSWTLCSLTTSLAASCFTAWLLIKRWPTDSSNTDTSNSEKSDS